MNLMSSGAVLSQQQKLSDTALLHPIDIAAVRGRVHSQGRNG